MGWGEREGIWTGIGLLIGSIFIIWREKWKRGRCGEKARGEGVRQMMILIQLSFF